MVQAHPWPVRQVQIAKGGPSRKIVPTRVNQSAVQQPLAQFAATALPLLSEDAAVAHGVTLQAKPLAKAFDQLNVERMAAPPSNTRLPPAPEDAYAINITPPATAEPQALALPKWVTSVAQLHAALLARTSAVSLANELGLLFHLITVPSTAKPRRTASITSRLRLSPLFATGAAAATYACIVLEAAGKCRPQHIQIT